MFIKMVVEVDFDPAKGALLLIHKNSGRTSTLTQIIDLLRLSL